MLCALSPAVLFCVNLRRYLPPGAANDLLLPAISVLIPARNEEESIGAAIESILTNTEVLFELIVMDDGSTDRTSEIVSAQALKDPRVRLEQAPILPAGWNGKQHACWALAKSAKCELLCFIDADVKLKADALSRMAAFLTRGDAALVSGFPRQITETWLEWMLLPMIHFVLLGFLPIMRMRNGTDPAFAAGCGQFILARRDAYFVACGHSKIRSTMHDGLLLPKRFRQCGYKTDLADLTELATCRMYRNARQVWQGLAKNATEGLAAPVRIVPISILFVMGQILPFGVAIWLWQTRAFTTPVFVYVLIGIVGAWLPRVLAVGRFRQDWRSALLHPAGMVLLLAVQWHSFARKLMGGAVRWKERSYAGE
nr:glycosyltransferase family 2 protein [Granulicella sp. S190]